MIRIEFIRICTMIINFCVGAIGMILFALAYAAFGGIAGIICGNVFALVLPDVFINTFNSLGLTIAKQDIGFIFFIIGLIIGFSKVDIELPFLAVSSGEKAFDRLLEERLEDEN